jgi:hypothetical protein
LIPVANHHSTIRLDTDSIGVAEVVVCEITIDDVIVFVFSPLAVSHVTSSPDLFDEVLLEFVFIVF